MNEEVTNQPTTIQPYAPDPPKGSVKYIVAKYVSPTMIWVGVIVILANVLIFMDEGTKSFVRRVAGVLGFGVYPLLMGFFLRNQARRQEVSHTNTYLNWIVGGAFLVWIGLMWALGAIVGGPGTPEDIPQSSPNVVVLFIGALFFYGGWRMFRKGLRLADESILTSLPPMPPGPEELHDLQESQESQDLQGLQETQEIRGPRDFTEAMSTWLVQETDRKNREWHFSLFPDAIQLEAVEGGEWFEVPRSRAHDDITLQFTRSREPWINVLSPKDVMIQLDQEKLAVLRDWIGPPSLDALKESLKRHTEWASIIATMYALVYVLPSLVPEPPMEDNMMRHVAAAVIAVWLAGVALAIHFRPHRMVLLFQAGLLVFLAVLLSVECALQPAGDTTLLVIGVLILMINTFASVSDYRGFTDVQYKRGPRDKAPKQVMYSLAAAIAIFVCIGIGMNSDSFNGGASAQGSQIESKGSR